MDIDSVNSFWDVIRFFWAGTFIVAREIFR